MRLAEPQHRAEGRKEGGRGQREKNTSGRKGENVRQGERRQNMQALGKARETRGREENGELLTCKIKCSGAETICKKSIESLVEREMMCRGQEEVMC